MKKKVTIILVFVVMILGLVGCGANKNQFQVGEKSNIVIPEKGVSLSIKEGTLTKKGATLVLKNDNRFTVQYEKVSYGIEIKKDGEWYRTDVQLFFADVAYDLKAKETIELDTKWENGYGKLAKGEYRIVKNIYHLTNDGTYEQFRVAAEFNIK
jgi:hypothetical protein